MQFNKNVGPENFIATVQREANGNTLQFEIKQKTTTASELNAQIKQFTDDNLIDELDSNTIQLVTEELVVMVLLQMLAPGLSLQYYIAHDCKKSTVTLGMGYPGESYNPFEVEENIFMINIFKEWITDIQFRNPNNDFNELLLTINVKPHTSELEGLISAESVPAATPVATPAAPATKTVTAAPAAPKQQAAGAPAKSVPPVRSAPAVKSAERSPYMAISKSIFDLEAGKMKRDSVPAGEVVESARDGVVQILELLIREKGITIENLYERLDSFFAPLDLRTKAIVFDTTPTAAEGSAKSVCKVLLSDLFERRAGKKIYIEFKLIYLKDDNELILQLRYPDEQYNPFVNNADGRGIKVLNRQKSVNVYYAYKDGMNRLVVVLDIVN